MKHIDEFTIHSFRGLREVKLEGLGQINLLVGENNSGKTTILEALSIFCDPLNWRKWSTSSSRETAPTSIPLSDRILWLFPRGAVLKKSISPDTSIEISLSSTGTFPLRKVLAHYEQFSEIMVVKQYGSSTPEEGETSYEDRERVVEGIRVYVSASVMPKQNEPLQEELKETLVFANYGPLPSGSKQELAVLPVRVVNPSSHRSGSIPSRLWTDVIYAEMKQGTIELLRSFDGDIQDIDITDKGRPEVSVKHRELVRAPLSTFGDGLRRVFTLASAIPSARGGLFLIDELEMAIHFGALGKTLDWLVKTCIQSDIQLFVTTHSLETVDALIDACKNVADLTTYRLERQNEKNVVTRLDEGLLTRLREDMSLEVR